MASNAHSEYLAKLPVDWEQVPVKALGTVHAGGTPSRDIPTYWNGTIPWVTPAEITRLESKCLSKTNERITAEGLGSSAAKLLPEGSLLVTTRATIGGVAVSKHPICTNQGFKNIVLNEMSNVDFYYHLFNIIVPELLRLASGSTFPDINQRSFESIIVPRPSKDEQRRIAEFLDTIDEVIQKTEALISKLKAMKQGLLHDLLTRGLDENGKLRDPKAHPEQFKDSPFGLIPKTWQVKTAGELLGNSILEDIQDGNHGEMHPKAGDFVSEGVPFLMAKDLSNGKCDFRGCYRITKEQYRSLRIGFATCEDILLSHKGTIGLTAIVPTNQPEVMLSPQVTYYRIAKRELLLPHYLRYWFKSTWFQRQLSIFSAQSTRSYIGITLQRTLPMLLPPPEEQAGITACFESHDARIRTEEQYRNKLKLQKRGLMHDLLAGKVRVKV